MLGVRYSSAPIRLRPKLVLVLLVLLVPIGLSG